MPVREDGTVPRGQVINKLREMGYKYTGQCDRTDCWRHGTSFLYLRRNKLIRIGQGLPAADFDL